MPNNITAGIEDGKPVFLLVADELVLQALQSQEVRRVTFKWTGERSLKGPGFDVIGRLKLFTTESRVEFLTRVDPRNPNYPAFPIFDVSTLVLYIVDQNGEWVRTIVSDGVVIGDELKG